MLRKTLYLLVRDEVGNAMCILSKRKGMGSESSLNICITFCETVQFDSNQQIFLFF